MSDKIKNKLEDKKSNSKDHVLTEFDWAMIQEFSLLLQFHTKQTEMMGNLMTSIARSQFGYEKVKAGYNLIFNIKDEEGMGILTITEVKA